jgi:nucleoside-diphosphate-sugar epimerase
MIQLNQEEYAIIGCGWLGKELLLSLSLISNSIITSTKHEISADKSNQSKRKNLLFDIYEGESFPKKLAAKTVIILIPPSSANQEQSYENAIESFVKNCLDLGTERIIYSSSTGVYENVSGVYSESDTLGDRIKSKLLRRVEESVLQCRNGLIIRFGGLINSERNPSKFGINSKLPGNEPINMVHQTDAVNSILYLININAHGVYNVVAPEHPSRSEFYNSAFKQNDQEPIDLIHSQNPVNRVISSDKLIQSGYSFIYPNPLQFPMKVTKN